MILSRQERSLDGRALTLNRGASAGACVWPKPKLPHAADISYHTSPAVLRELWRSLTPPNIGPFNIGALFQWFDHPM